LCSALISGQGVTRKHTVALSPVPLWPGDEKTTELPKGQSVVYDPPSGEYVVYYVAEAFAAKPLLLRFVTHALIDPEITFHVVAAAEGSHYTYSVMNGPLARQSIQKISMLISADSAPQPSGSGWSSNLTGKARDIAAPSSNSARIEWKSNVATQSISPGTRMDGFAIDSTPRPGFTGIVFRGATQSQEYNPEAVSSLPPEIRHELDRIFTGTWDAKSCIVIAPKFAKSTAQSEIAQNFLFRIKALIRGKRLDPSSPFVAGAVQLLSAQVDSGGLASLRSEKIRFLGTGAARSGDNDCKCPASCI
jgi:hypothetical protein